MENPSSKGKGSEWQKGKGREWQKGKGSEWQKGRAIFLCRQRMTNVFDMVDWMAEGVMKHTIRDDTARKEMTRIAIRGVKDDILSELYKRGRYVLRIRKLDRSGQSSDADKTRDVYKGGSRLEEKGKGGYEGTLSVADDPMEKIRPRWRWQLAVKSENRWDMALILVTALKAAQGDRSRYHEIITALDTREEEEW